MCSVAHRTVILKPQKSKNSFVKLMSLIPQEALVSFTVIANNMFVCMCLLYNVVMNHLCYTINTGYIV